MFSEGQAATSSYKRNKLCIRCETLMSTITTIGWAEGEQFLHYTFESLVQICNQNRSLKGGGFVVEEVSSRGRVGERGADGTVVESGSGTKHEVDRGTTRQCRFHVADDAL